MAAEAPRTVSVSTALFDGYPMERAVAEIAAAGGRSVELAFIKGYVEFEEAVFARPLDAAVVKALDRYGVAVEAVSAHMDLARPDAVSMLKARIGFAGAVGAKFLVTNAGAARDRTAILRAIERVLKDCEAAGVVLALENPGHGSGDLIADAGAGAQLARAVASPHLRLNYDVGNVFTYSREALQPQADIAAALPWLAHVHLKDVARRGGDWVFCAIGDGAIDYPVLWRRLPRDIPLGIELPLRLERRGRADPRRREEPVPLPEIRVALRRSLDFVVSLDRG